MTIDETILRQFVDPSGIGATYGNETFNAVGHALLEFLQSANQSPPLPGFDRLPEQGFFPQLHGNELKDRYFCDQYTR